MKTFTQYREFADHCLDLAKRAKTEEERKILRHMAEAWQKLAQEAKEQKP
jgi:hypothetical protein